MLRESDLVRALRRKKPQTLPAVVEAATTKAPFPARLRRPSSQKARGPLPNAGLKNLGNTCFLNATLQCLFGCAEFCAGFVERQYPLAAKSPAGGKIAMSFAELLSDIAQDKSIVSPSNLRKSLTKIAPQFRGNGQHDSQELLRCLHDGLAEDLKRPPPPSPVTWDPTSHPPHPPHLSRHRHVRTFGVRCTRSELEHAGGECREHRVPLRCWE